MKKFHKSKKPKQFVRDGGFKMYELKPGYKILNAMVKDDKFGTDEWDDAYKKAFTGTKLLMEVKMTALFDATRTQQTVA